MIYLIPTIFFVYGYLYYRKIVRFIEMPFMEQAPCFLKKNTQSIKHKRLDGTQSTMFLRQGIYGSIEKSG